jgi:LuxR family transcriptional regulator, quorum-sensing system regulator BjaR1
MRELAAIDPVWALRSLEYINELEATATPDGILKLFKHAIGEAGFHSFIITVVDDHERNFARRVVARSWHPEWSVVYEKEKMTDVDPVRRKVSCSSRPFMWSDAYDASKKSRARRVMDRATDFRMNQGLCVPVHHYGHPVAAVNVSAEDPDLGSGVREALHLMSLATYNRFSALIIPPVWNDHLLTSREREVIKWLAAGKSDWDISTILHISERTARAHAANAARKLNAANRPALILEAVRLGALSVRHWN